MRFLALVPAVLLSGACLAQKPLTLTILHSNDLHSHEDPTAIKGKMYGGLARITTVIKQVRAKEKNVILLNAGDCFQGTLFFNIYDGLAEAAVLDKMGYQASCIGNHEFDKGVPNLVDFCKHVNFPMLACNIDMTKEPELAKVVKPYTILTVDKQKIGVVGLITDTTGNITLGADNLVFEKHLAPTQKAVDELTKQGVNKIIVLSHIGYEEDQQLAAKLHNVDLIVGGHSHTPLGTPALDGWRPAAGPYPTYVKDADGNSVPIVQAWEWGKVFGDIKVQFDAKGKLTKVLEAKPIVIDASIPEDPEVASLIDTLRKPVTAMGDAVLGTSSEAYTDRTSVGYFVADSYLMATSKLGTNLALMNPGGVRANLEAGKITFTAANSICPFRNSLVIAEMTGAQIIAVLNDSKGSLIPSKGTHYTVAGGGVRDLMINGEAVDVGKTYKVVVNNFMAGGGDNLATLKDVKKLDTGLSDIDAFVDYIKANSPLSTGGEVRIGH
ncbi:MAG: 5'-nucleotidase C-terminal domain-containing protein [Armatimonadetes bacterium]|nr:5'-nucleotidase C-terminal domain-containing protein [Armatimonadota bacterium]MBS1728400.1 5'-nucleotidase C-terminal domain-containing protein [Armatimonadota bacterium]